METGPFLRTDQAANHLNVSKSLLEKLRLTGGGPTFRKLGHVVVYGMSDLEEWLDSRRYSSTAEYGE